MKRNGMCPVCFARNIIAPKGRNNIPVLYNIEPYDNGTCLTPPMGWSSWNTFHERIDQDVILGMAKVMKEKGLADAGYVYVNIDDCWEAKERTMSGELTHDLKTFPDGIEYLVNEVNKLGMKLGIYSSNGVMTCQDFPATLGFEYTDAYTFAKWGVEYWKLDFCHHIDYTKYAPLVAGISVAKQGEQDKILTAEEGTLSGYAHIFRSNFAGKHHRYSNQKLKTHVSGLDAGLGSVEYNVAVEEEGEYVLTVYTHERYSYEKFLGVLVNGVKLYTMKIPAHIHWNEYYTQKLVTLRKGINTIKLFNPIINRATSDMLQYQYAGECIKQAVKDYAAASGKEEKKMIFSLCEWGAGHPYLWGASAGNLWRTTGDIREEWKSVMSIYEHNVKLHEYASIGAWNDPDMLEVGVGDMTYTENVSHFALWCMMAAPLILGNDIRKITDEILALVKNKTLIAINQDKLGKQAKRIVKGSTDILVKPLSEGKTAICVLNKSGSEKSYSVDEKALKEEGYISYKHSDKAIDAVAEATVSTASVLSGRIESHGVKVFII